MNKLLFFGSFLILSNFLYADEPVSPQTTGAVTSTNVKVLGEAPAMAMGNLYQVACQKHCQIHNFSQMPVSLTKGNTSEVLRAGETKGITTLYNNDIQIQSSVQTSTTKVWPNQLIILNKK